MYPGFVYVAVVPCLQRAVAGVRASVAGHDSEEPQPEGQARKGDAATLVHVVPHLSFCPYQKP